MIEWFRWQLYVCKHKQLAILESVCWSRSFHQHPVTFRGMTKPPQKLTYLSLGKPENHLHKPPWFAPIFDISSQLLAASYRKIMEGALFFHRRGEATALFDTWLGFGMGFRSFRTLLSRKSLKRKGLVYQFICFNSTFLIQHVFWSTYFQTQWNWANFCFEGGGVDII